MKIANSVTEKLTVPAAIAALFLAIPAAAQSSAYVDQIGSGNDATINQTGNGNAVGDVDPDRRARQEGDDNTLSVVQNEGDKVGTGGNYLNNNIGLNQMGNRNTLTIDQGAAQGQRVFVAQQVGDDNGASVTQSGNAAVSTLSQTGTENSMLVSQTGAAFQRNTVGDAGGSRFVASRGAFQEGDGNLMEISQGGGGNNDVKIARQIQQDNIMSVSQSGGLNVFESVEQTGNSNEAQVTQIGTSNGRIANAGNFTGDAAAVGLVESTVAQTGDFNMVSVMSEGDRNLFAVSQTGNTNELLGIQFGNDNEAAVLQSGDNHVADFNQVGNGNVLAITQN